jgi:hypothetical protein
MSSIRAESSLHCVPNDGYPILPSSAVPELHPFEPSASLYITTGEYHSQVSSIDNSYSYSIDKLLSLRYTTRISRGARRFTRCDYGSLFLTLPLDNPRF